MINLPVSPSVVPALSKKEQQVYTRCLREVHEDLKLIHKAFVRLARNLAKIRDRRLYFAGGYATFEEFCGRELGRSRQQIYRIIAAHDTLQLLLDAGIPESDLPETERLCREIRALPPEAQAPVWRAVHRAKAKPTIIDIQEEAVKHLNSSATIERQQKEVLQRLESAGRALKVGLPFDAMTPDFRRRLTVALMAIAETATLLLKALESKTLTDRSETNQLAEREDSKQEPATKSKKQQPTATLGGVPTYIEPGAAEKARIIKEEIAKHHGERK
jgi:hypothetical protein